MPTRILREGIIDSKAVNALSDGAEVFYRRLYSIVDDYGRFEADLDLLLAKVFGRQISRRSLDDVRAMLNECNRTYNSEGQPLVCVYNVGNKQFLEISKFGQRIRTKSRYPDPPRRAGESPTRADICPQMLAQSESESESNSESYAEAESSVGVGKAGESPANGAAAAARPTDDRRRMLRQEEPKHVSESLPSLPAAGESPDADLVSCIGAFLAEYVSEHKKRGGDVQLSGEPPAKECRQIAQILLQAKCADPAAALKSLLLAKWEQGVCPQKSWRYFVKLIQNAVEEGDLNGSCNASQAVRPEARTSPQ